MPPNSDGSYQISGQGSTVTARALAGEERCAHVGLAGDIDMAASGVLSETIDWLAALAPAYVLIDLADVAFACSTLPNFVVRVRRALPDGAELILSGAGPATGWLLQVTNMSAIATLRDEPTESQPVSVREPG